MRRQNRETMLAAIAATSWVIVSLGLCWASLTGVLP